MTVLKSAIVFTFPMILLSTVVLVCGLNFPPGSESGDSGKKWIFLTIVGIAFSICGIAVTFLCTCCKDAWQAKPNTLPYENYQCGPDSPNPLEDQVIIEPLPDVVKNRNFNNNNNNESQQPFRPKPMDFNNAINRGLIDGDHSEWTKSPSKINLHRNQMKYIQEIGQGWFGQVVEGEVNRRIRGEFVSIFDDKLDKVAVQILNGDLASVEKGYVLYKAQKFRMLEHENLIKLIAAYFETQPYLLVYQYFGQKSDLKHYLVKNRANCDSFLENNFLLSYALDVARGLAFLHENDYTFNDLACRNCFIDKQNRVKIGDYGVSTDIFQKEYMVRNGVAIPFRWAAPETLSIEDSSNGGFSVIVKEIDKKANVWSFGVTMWEILEFAKLPYMSLNDEEVVLKVIKQKVETLAEPLVPMRFRDKCYKLIRFCMDFDPKLRPDMQKVAELLNYLNHNYRNVIANMPLDVDFETKWNKLSDTAVFEHSKANTEKSSDVDGQDHLEKIDKRNFVLTLSDQELEELTENELSTFFEYLNEKEIDDLLTRRRILCSKNDKISIIKDIDFTNLTRQNIADILDKLQNVEDVLAFKRHIFEHLSRQIDGTRKIDNQWSSINEFIDFLDLDEADEIRKKFQQNVHKEENPQIVDDSVKKLSIAEKNNINPTNRENLTEIVSPFNGEDAKKTSTPLSKSKNTNKIANKKQIVLPEMTAYPRNRTEPDALEDQSRNSQKANASHFEQVRRQISSLSEDTVNKMSVEELEQQYFGFMSPEEILDMLQRKKSDSRSLSSSFFRRSVPSKSASPELFDPEVSKASVFSPEKAKLQVDKHNSNLPSVSASDTSISPGRNFIKPETNEYFKITPNISLSNSTFTSDTSKDDHSFEALQQLSDTSSPFMSSRPKRVVFQADASFIVETDENTNSAHAESTPNRNENSNKSTSTVNQSTSSNISAVSYSTATTEWTENLL